MATKEKLNVENLPLVIDGKVEMVPKRQYLNHKAQTLTIKHKAAIKKSDVEGMIEMIVAGKELEAGNDEPWPAVYKEIQEDIELAQDKNAEAVAAANAAAEEAKKAEQAKLEKEAQLVEVAANTDVAATFASLSENFDLGNMDRCVPNEGTTDEQVMAALVTGIKMDNFSNWAKGDLVAELEKRGHENAMVKLCEQTGIPYKSIYRMAVTARNVPPNDRKPNVSFTTYAEAATARYSKDENENQKLLNEVISRVGVKQKTGDAKSDEAKNSQVITTAQEARKAVLEAQGKTAPEPADPMAVDLEKHSFLIIRDGTLSVSVGFPFSIAGESEATIVHLKTARACYDEKGKKWTAIEKHEEPAKEEDKKDDKKEGDKTKAKTEPAKAAAAAAPAKKGGKKK